MSKLIISTLNWDGKDKLEKLYPTLINNLKNIDYKWVIKDNASKDGSIELIKSWNNPNIILCEYPNNKQNFSEGVNYCFDQANPDDDDLFLLLNNDIIFNDTTSIKNMIASLKDDVGIVGAKLLYTGTNQIQHAGVILDAQYRAPFHFRSGQLDDINSSKNRYFQAVTGAVLLIKAKDFKDVGKCDINLKWSFDDICLCLSIKYNLNKKILYCGKTNIFHEESASLKKNPVNKLFMNHNLDYFRNKWGDKMVMDKIFYDADPNYNLAE